MSSEDVPSQEELEAKMAASDPLGAAGSSDNTDGPQEPVKAEPVCRCIYACPRHLRVTERTS